MRKGKTKMIHYIFKKKWHSISLLRFWTLESYKPALESQLCPRLGLINLVKAQLLLEYEAPPESMSGGILWRVNATMHNDSWHTVKDLVNVNCSHYQAFKFSQFCLLFSIWHIPQIHEDSFVLPKLVFCSCTFLNHSFLCIWFSGVPKVPDPKGMTSMVSVCLTDSGNGAGLEQEFCKRAYLKWEYM